MPYAGAHYEKTGTVITKYYFAGSTRVAMRKYTIPQNMTVEYLLSDHLGSTSMTADVNGAKVSEIRYKPWGEVRYAWTDAPANTSPVYALTRYTFTGQYAYLDDPTTSASEGFGLMFYNARWLDPVTGRFAQADSIVPAGAQGLDRYAYVNNNPLRFTDPSGHRCFPENECESPLGDFPQPDVPLTNNGDLGACSRDNCDGVRMKLLYQYYLTHGGFWNNFDVANGFTPQQFLAFMLMAEAGGDSALLAAIMDAAGVQIGSGVIAANGQVEIPAYCPGSTCINGVFNFLAAYSQSAWGRYNAVIDENYAIVEQPPVNYDITSGSSQLNAVAATMVTLYSVRHSRTNDLPTNWGVYCPTCSDSSKNDPYLAWMGNVAGPVTGTTNRCGIYYLGGGAGALTVVYTANQEYNWSNGNCH